ncbi:phosphoribosylglycinamide formyltransferase [Isoptericola sp. b441]|uniref:Phosphoribosylglycinamide formyltransferase n=1 Tax=Actinotalea lenta TaxID=3064654 RepID=A0ABT9D4L1_9CELL|nr:MULTISPECIES: phosphoribosylglycinamide formyltransferase [unclassified Isoptericola]MDO8105622.1 phosphoribosylglycinamide formyltransferase [Isoptericola sp. b441]MDO8122742.1 phosphoribosylglycinamide formyltransferase [Isoptericola sp. b490]
MPHDARLVVLVSGAGSNLAALLAAQQDPAYPARVVAVVSDRPDAGGLDVARAAGVATVVVRPADFADRAAWDAALARAVGALDPAWVVSAGFMRILGAPFLAQHGGRVLNTHPALLPSFPGAHAVRDALEHGVAVTGCTLHLIDEGVDTGPILAQRAVDVLPDDDESSLHERIKVAERAMLVETVAQVVRRGVAVDGRRARIGR